MRMRAVPDDSSRPSSPAAYVYFAQFADAEIQPSMVSVQSVTAISASGSSGGAAAVAFDVVLSTNASAAFVTLETSGGVGGDGGAVGGRFEDNSFHLGTGESARVRFTCRTQPCPITVAQFTRALSVRTLADTLVDSEEEVRKEGESQAIPPNVGGAAVDDPSSLLKLRYAHSRR